MKVLYILAAILGFGFLIFIHELGHYLMARLFRVTINEFAIGMGPRLFWYESKKTHTVYSLRMFPIGGFVSMAGEDDESEDPNAFHTKAAWKRFLITAAGAAMNLLLGFLLMFIIICNTRLFSTTVRGFYRQEDTGFSVTTYGTLQAGDELIRVNGRRVYIYYDIAYEVAHSGTRPLEVELIRNGERMTLMVEFPVVEQQDMYFGQVDFATEEESRNPLSCARHAFHYSTATMRMIWDSLFDLLRGRYGMEAVSGPVGVAGAMTEAASAGIIDYLFLLVVLSINLGMFNLLPIPALDGGRLLFLLIEMIARRPVPQKYEAMVHFIGMLLLLGLVLVITFKDIVTLFR